MGLDGNKISKLSDTPESDTRIMLAKFKEKIEKPKPVVLPFPSESEGDWSMKMNSEYFMKFKNGEVSNTYRRENVVIDKKTKTYLFDDHGLLFYKVQPGDTLGSITQKIVRSNSEDFSYLKPIQARRSSGNRGVRQSAKINGFNIPANKVKAGMWLPVPWEQKDREVSEKLLLNYATIAIDQMKKHKKYGPYTNVIVSKLGKENLAALMLATAKQESGGEPIGKFEFHRWENHQSCFSFSLFHVLMKGPGLHARKNLELTEGQTYHPVNACKLFLGFIIEKLIEGGEKGFLSRLQSISGVSQGNFDGYATFYNGTSWKRTNPQYTKNMGNFFGDAKSLLAASESNKKIVATRAANKNNT